MNDPGATLPHPKTTPSPRSGARRDIEIPLDGIRLRGDLVVPPQADGLVLFAHGSGSSHLSPRNRFVARKLEDARIGTLVFDLLTLEEERRDQSTGHWRFDIELLAHRLLQVTHWVARQPLAQDLGRGYFGSSTGAAAALVAAARMGLGIKAVVSRGGRPDMAGAALPRVTAATLLIVGGNDPDVLELNQKAYSQLACDRRLQIVPGATHLFEEPGTLEQVADHAVVWFHTYLRPIGKI